MTKNLIALLFIVSSTISFISCQLESNENQKTDVAKNDIKSQEIKKTEFDIGLSNEFLKNFSIDTLTLDTLNGTMKSRDTLIRGKVKIFYSQSNHKKDGSHFFIEYYIDPSSKNELEFSVFDRFDELREKDIISVTYDSKFGSKKLGCGRCLDVKRKDNSYALEKKLELTEIETLSQIFQADTVFVSYQQRILDEAFFKVIDNDDIQAAKAVLKLYQEIRTEHENILREIK